MFFIQPRYYYIFVDILGSYILNSIFFIDSVNSFIKLHYIFDKKNYEYRIGLTIQLQTIRAFSAFLIFVSFTTIKNSIVFHRK